MDFALTESQELIRREVSALARAFGWEYWREKDKKGEYPSEFFEAFAQAGWLGIVIPEVYGGAELGVTEAALMLEAICASGAGLSGASPIHFAVFPPMPIVKHGSERLRQRILPGIAKGTLSLAFGVTEPNAGSDTSRIQTTARRDGASWVVTGRNGYAKEFDVERLWREVRLYKIAPVSQQMALNYLAEHVLGLPRSY